MMNLNIPYAWRHPLGVHICLQPTARIESYSFKFVKVIDILSVAQPAVVLSTRISVAVFATPGITRYREKCKKVLGN